MRDKGREGDPRMGIELLGRTALITGGAKRIGRAIALALAGAGADVVVNYRSSRADAESLVEEITELGRGAWAVQADLTVDEQLQGLIDKAAGLAGGLDILINNASVFPESSFETFSLNDLLESIRVDAWPAVALGRAFAKRVESGHIVNMLDSRLVGYDWKHVAYHAGKHLLLLFTREMAIRLAPGIAVNGVAPGLILPPEGKDQSYLEALKDRLPLKRIGDPEYIADAVLYLVTSSFITGQVIYVDGGRHLTEVSIG